jgi:hypothetical protein
VAENQPPGQGIQQLSLIHVFFQDKKNAFKKAHRSEFSNCLIQDDTALLHLSSSLHESYIMSDVDNINAEDYTGRLNTWILF